jgi:8-oxo-dGTP pyrophosphatase MutT (NUDIX family)
MSNKLIDYLQNGRCQCIVTRGNKILMVRHVEHGLSYLCLPGGGTEPGESTKTPRGEARKQDILNYLAGHSDAKTSEIAEAISLSDGRVRAYLQQLTLDGIIIADGETHNRTYRLNPKSYELR